MPNYTEIEIKHQLLNPESVIEKLNSMGAKELFTGQGQNDLYYIPAHRDFLEPPTISEWLRVRITDKGASFNYKRWLPLEAEIKTHCDEYETKIADPQALKKILESLDMREIVRVNKRRSAWMLDGVEIALDIVDGLGTFIELEAKEIPGTVEEVTQALKAMLDRLDAEVLPQDRRGYPYWLLKPEK